MSRIAIFAVTAWLTVTNACLPADTPSAQATPQGPASAAQQRQRTNAEIQRLIRVANQLKSAGKVAEAIAAITGRSGAVAGCASGSADARVAGTGYAAGCAMTIGRAADWRTHCQSSPTL